MEQKTKKYLLYGGAAVVGFVIYSKFKASSAEHKADKKEKAKATPPATGPQAAPYVPLSLPIPGAYPSYIPQQYPYPVPQYPGSGYPPYVPPISSYPGYPNYPPPYTPGAGGTQYVIGQSVTTARQILQSQGYYVQIISVNGRITPRPAYGGPPPGVPVAGLDIVSGLVTNVRYSGQLGPYQPAVAY